MITVIKYGSVPHATSYHGDCGNCHSQIEHEARDAGVLVKEICGKRHCSLRCPVCGEMMITVPKRVPAQSQQMPRPMPPKESFLAGLLGWRS